MRVTGFIGAAIVLSAISGCTKATTAPKPATSAGESIPEIGPLPNVEFNAAKAELGKHLFFDRRLSGDDVIACSTCHDPSKGWADGKALSLAYPGSDYFRSSKPYINSVHARYFYWDGRLTGKDGATMARDAITETHFLNMDGRLMFMRLQQVPEYVAMFEKAFGKEPNFGRTLKALAEFQKTIVSKNVPYDQYVKGKGSLPDDALAGLEVFQGKGRCIQCHNGPYFSDGKAHRMGVGENPEIVATPLRHITMRSVFKFMGVDNFENVKTDVGHYVVSKEEKDRGAFLTPTLRELGHTAPYMHNGMYATLDDVIEFYNSGGEMNNLPRDSMLKPLGLTSKEKKDLKAFLLALTGDPVIVEAPARYEYKLIENWEQVAN